MSPYQDVQNMNRAQIIIFQFGLFFVVVMCVFPPYEVTVSREVTNDAGERSLAFDTAYRYQFILTGVEQREKSVDAALAVSWNRLRRQLQWSVLATIILMVAFRTRRSGGRRGGDSGGDGQSGGEDPPVFSPGGMDRRPNRTLETA
jgi:hypothetical protein